jgi:site-specific recombinase
MKISFLRLCVMWRRFRRGSRLHHEHRLQYQAQMEALMRRANPFAGWNERANWMNDVADWLRRGPKAALMDEQARKRMRHQRIQSLLDWLDGHRDVRRVVQATLQKTLREAVGPELFCATGLPREPAFFSELSGRIARMILPTPPAKDLSALFTAMFREKADAEWLFELDQKTLSRFWKLCSDDSIAHKYRQQVDEALVYLVTMIVAVGVSQDFRHRLEPRMPLQSMPFMALRRELERYLLAPAHDESALRSVRMLIAVCQAQTDRIYADLDEHGVSVGLVYRIERMRAQLARMARLIDLRSAPAATHGAGHVQALFAELLDAHHHRSSVLGLAGRSFNLLARKMVERNADRGERYIARDRSEYRAMLKAGCVGGVVAAFAVLGHLALSDAGHAGFFEGLYASLNYVVVFLAISAVGGTLAAKQPVVTAPALAAKMQALDTADGLGALLREAALLLRAQAAAMLGNLIAVVPTMLAVALAAFLLSGAPMMQAASAHASLAGLSILGPAPLFAAFTGILLLLSGLFAGFADNWFALRRLRDALAHHRRLVQALGTARAQRWAAWLETHFAAIIGNVALGILLGMTPVIGQFFGLPLDVRHITLSAGTLAAAAGSLGWSVFASSQFWLALAGVALIAILNVGIAFGGALTLALRARDVPGPTRRLVFRAVLRRFAASPLAFLLPVRQKAETAVPAPQADAAGAQEEEERRFGSGG